MQTTVKEVMTSPALAVHEQARFSGIVAELRARRISALPVVDDDGRVTGVVSEADLLLKEASHANRILGLRDRAERVKAAAVTAAQLMTRPPVVTTPDTTVEDAARLMYEQHVKHLPVVDDSGQLIGIVSRLDLLGIFTRTDADISEDISDLLGAVLLIDPHAFRIHVDDGIVTLEGEAESFWAAREIVQAVDRIEGVVAVRDQLTYLSGGAPQPAG